MSAPLPTTKLHIPPVRPELVSRPHLIERLNVVPELMDCAKYSVKTFAKRELSETVELILNLEQVKIIREITETLWVITRALTRDGGQSEEDWLICKPCAVPITEQ